MVTPTQNESGNSIVALLCCPKRLFGAVDCFRIWICDVLSQLKCSAKGKYNLLQELEQLKHLSTSCWWSHHKVKEEQPNVVITEEKKSSKSNESCIPCIIIYMSSDKVTLDVDFTDKPVAQSIVCSSCSKHVSLVLNIYHWYF